MIVSVGILPLALSVGTTLETITLAEHVRRLLATEFSGYDQFVTTKVDEHVVQRQRVVSDWVRATFGDESSVEGLEELQTRIIRPLHVGALDLVGAGLDDLGNVTPSELLSPGLFGHMRREVQVAEVDFGRVSECLEEALLPLASEGMPVSLEVQPAENVNWGSEWRRSRGTWLFRFPFEFWEPDCLNPRKVRPANYRAPVVYTALRGSSFLDWTASSDESGKVSELRFGWLVSLDSPLHRIPEEEKGRIFEELRRSQMTEVAIATLRGRITVYGLRVSALLAGIATPIVLTMLCYFLAMHARHLAQLADDEMCEVRQSAWLPVMLRSATWSACASIASMVVAPVAALCFLGGELATSGLIPRGSEGVVRRVIWAGQCGIVVFGLVGLHAIRGLRGQRAQSS